MADPLTIGLIAGGGMGVGKYLGDVAGNANDRKLNATIAKWSPWTKMNPEKARSANFIGDLAPGLLGGLAFGALNPGGVLGAAAPTVAGAGAAGTLGATDLSLSPWTQAGGMLA